MIQRRPNSLGWDKTVFTWRSLNSPRFIEKFLERVKQDTVGSANPVFQRLRKRHWEAAGGGENRGRGVSRRNTARQLQKLPVKRS